MTTKFLNNIDLNGTLTIAGSGGTNGYFLKTDGTGVISWAVGGGGSTTNALVIKSDSGTTEGTDLYTFNGSVAKTLNFVSGTNLTIAETAGTFTFNATDTNTFPQTWTWTAGTTAGPTASITGTSSTISVAAVPVANGVTASGVVTTGTQTLGGAKTFSSAVTAAGLTLSSTTSPITLNATVGTTGQVLSSAGAGATPAWRDGPVDGTTSTGTTGFGFMGLPQNATTTGAYTVAAADAGKHIYASATRTVTIPANTGGVAFPIGTTLTFIAGSGATMTIAITTDTMYLAGAGTTGSRTLAPFGMATAVKITSTAWMISGNGLT